MSPAPPEAGPPRTGAEVLAGAGGPESRLAPFFECWLDTFIFNGRIDAELRELAILRVMWRCGQSFEWANHYRIARGIGLSRDQIIAIRTAAPDRDLSGAARVVVRAADEVVDRGNLSRETLAAVADIFKDPELLREFLYLLAGYRMFASVSATNQVSAETRGLRVWPPDGIGPNQPTT